MSAKQERVPYSGEVVWAMELRNQAGRYCRLDASHPIPITPEEIERANKISQKLMEWLQDDLLGFRFSGELMSMADSLVDSGEITEKQYLSIHDVYRRIALGDEYRPFDTPKSFLVKFGSIYDRKAQTA